MSAPATAIYLTRIEITGTLAAVEAVAQSAPVRPPAPLVSAAAKLKAGLKEGGAR